MKYTRKKKVIKKLGAQIKKYRQEQDITQAQLAYESKLPINQIGRIERGEVNTSVSQVVAIAEALDIKLSDMFNF